MARELDKLNQYIKYKLLQAVALDISLLGEIKRDW